MYLYYCVLYFDILRYLLRTYNLSRLYLFGCSIIYVDSQIRKWFITLLKERSNRAATVVLLSTDYHTMIICNYKLCLDNWSYIRGCIALLGSWKYLIIKFCSFIYNPENVQIHCRGLFYFPVYKFWIIVLVLKLYVTRVENLKWLSYEYIDPIKNILLLNLGRIN